MGNLVNPYRHPVGSLNDTRFIAPLHPVWADVYYSKLVTDMGLGTMSDSRTVCFTAVVKYSARPSTHYPRIFQFSQDNWDDSAVRIGFAPTGALFFDCSTTSKVTITSLTPQIQAVVPDWCDGVTRRVAIICDLDNFGDPTTGMWLNGTQVISGWTGAPTADPFPWASVDRWGILVDTYGGTLWQNAVAGDGVGMYSLSTTRTLNPANVFDGSGYFTNPGKHFLNWYSERPEFAFINAPYVNQGWVHWVTGKKFNHTPNTTWDYLATSEAHHMKTVTQPGGNAEVNAGVVY
jgi:hypothetical protein